MSGSRFWTPPAFGGPNEPLSMPAPITITPPNSVYSPRITAGGRHIVPLLGPRRQFPRSPLRAPSPIHFLPRVKLFLDVREPNTSFCSICYETFTMLAIVTDLQCNHLMHHNCLVEWIFQHNSCPICRGAVTTR